MAKRSVVKVPGMAGHRNPIPTCVTLGDLILPSVISGHDPSGTDPIWTASGRSWSTSRTSATASS